MQQQQVQVQHDAPCDAFTSVYVKGLASEVGEEQLRAAFEPLGPVASAVVIRDSTGRPRGFGFVTLEQEDDARRAVAQLDGYVHTPGAEPWTVTRAQAREKRQQETQAHLDRVSSRTWAHYVGQPVQLVHCIALMREDR